MRAILCSVLLIACGDDAAGPDGGVRDAGAPIDGDSPRRDGATIDGGMPCVPIAPAPGFHVTTDGSASGDGSMEMPWDLASALANESLAPGSIVYVHAGTYAGTFSASLRGTEAEPIVVRAWPGDRATLDGAGSGDAVLTVSGEYARYQDLEITNSDSSNRVTEMTGSSPSDIVRGNGVVCSDARGIELVNLVVHDTSQGVSFWQGAIDSTVYGTIVYANGWVAPDRAHGHAIYTQNLEGTKRIAENILFHGFSYGVHAYTEGGNIQGFDFIGNVLFQTGTPPAGGREGGTDFLIGGLQPAARIRVIENLGWSRERDRRVLALGYDAMNEDIEVRGNYIAGGVDFNAPWSSIAMTGNTFVGEVSGEVETASYPDNEYLASDPTETRAFVRPNAYEPGRANVVVYNWAGSATVDIDPSGVLANGARWELRDVESYFGAPVASGTYAGGAITVPMADVEVAQPAGIPGGIEASERTTDAFGAYVLRTLACE